MGLKRPHLLFTRFSPPHSRPAPLLAHIYSRTRVLSPLPFPIPTHCVYTPKSSLSLTQNDCFVLHLQFQYSLISIPSITQKPLQNPNRCLLVECDLCNITILVYPRSPMDISAQAHNSVSLTLSHGPHPRIRPSLPRSSISVRKIIQSSAWRKEYCEVRTPSLIVAAADYSERRPRKNLVPRSKGPASKGFMPKFEVQKSTQKRDQREDAKKERLETSTSSDYGDFDSKEKINFSDEHRSEAIGESNLRNVVPQLQVGTTSQGMDQSDHIEKGSASHSNYNRDSRLSGGKDDVSEEKTGEDVLEHSRMSLNLQTNEMLKDPELKKDERTRTLNQPMVVKSDELDDTEGEITVMDKKKVTELEKPKIANRDASTVGMNLVVEVNYMQERSDIDDSEDEDDIITQNALGNVAVLKSAEVEAQAMMVVTNDIPSLEEQSDLEEVLTSKGVPTLQSEPENNEGKIGNETDSVEDKPNEISTEVKTDVDLGEEKYLENDKHVVRKKRDMEELLLKQNLQMEVEAREIQKFIEDLAQENLLLGNKLFVHPQVVKTNQNVKVFLNKSISSLKDESDVLIMGAFNDWRWKFFNEKLCKTDLKGDWWSCEVYIPKEAYKMDFVFFNGGDVYENNDSKDFFILVEDGMDVSSFEDLLLEEKQKELEKLAAEQVEKERLAEEQRRMEAEKAAEHVDRAHAKNEVARRREIFHGLIKKAVNSLEKVWYIEPSEFKPEDVIRLYYNRAFGPLAHVKEVWIHGGHNNWKHGLSIVGRLEVTEGKASDWCHVDVVVPDHALILDWVFADGPPGSARVYDNNHYKDYHASVPNSILEELYWVEEEHQIYRHLQEERKKREEAIRAKAEKTARMKAETREKTMKMFLLSQKHIVYTEPLDVQAGSTVTIFYNPSNTVLSGRTEIYFRCSFNRWTHRLGPLPPQKMVPAENGSHLKATVKVPLDAYMLDFVFSEKEDGGIYDNRNGMDYHIPVAGGVIKAPPMHIVHVAVEMAPIAKVGGLGDVVTSLSRAVQDMGHNVDIILPKYDCMNFSNVKDFQFNRSYSWGGTEIKVWHGKVEGLPVYFIEPLNGMFSVGCIYGCGNDSDRFVFFCHSALELLQLSGFRPDILHCHDWSSAPVAWLYRDHYMQYGLSNARIVFTIHNLEFGAGFIGKAMANSDKSTTVSPNYAREVSHNSIISPSLHKFHGILNGIDPDIWDPYNDKFIPISYTSENVVEGKRAAKESLQRRLSLSTSDRPLVGIITRLTHQKGIHLIKHAIWRTLERDGQVVLLGSAPDPRIQNDFVNLANKLHSSHNDRARLCLTYDEPLSHLIYGGADFILVPSIFEPCGLTQLIAMRYGCIPVVRKTGGLYDTVFDIDHDKERALAQGLEPNGFSFDGADDSGVDYALNRAISAWYNGRDWFNSLCKRVMEQDWSWNRPALDYLELYYAARK